MFFGVPAMYQFLLRLPDLADRDLSCWRTGLFGAAPMPAGAVERLVTALPQVSFIQLCGQTEAGPGGVYCDVEQVKARPDASGRQALPFTEARVADPEGRDVGPGGVGELLLRGESVMKGYWNKPAETAEALRGGWLHTGDLARVDADGYLTLVGATASPGTRSRTTSSPVPYRATRPARSSSTSCARRWPSGKPRQAKHGCAAPTRDVAEPVAPVMMRRAGGRR
jgi:acyl-CoA synthetase (AMP-forming)/AMP-acid ligase II